MNFVSVKVQSDFFACKIFNEKLNLSIDSISIIAFADITKVSIILLSIKPTPIIEIGKSFLLKKEIFAK